MARLRLLSRRSERLLCIRRIATPFSSVAKSNPRCTDRIPVDISVLLAERRSIEGLGSEVMLPILLWLRVRDVNDAVVRRLREGRVLRNSGSCARSLCGLILYTYRRVSISLGLKANVYALYRYRGSRARQTVMGKHNQK